MLDVFGGTLDRRLVDGSFPLEIRQALASQQTRLAAADIPQNYDPETRQRVHRLIDLSFVSGFRVAMLIAAGLAERVVQPLNEAGIATDVFRGGEPEPAIATLLPLFAEGGSGLTHPSAKARSAIAHSIVLMVTGLSSRLSVHEASHGAGHTRPVTSGKLLVLWRLRAASRQLPR